MMRRYSEHRRFLALRACWTILRGGSVAYKINFTDGGGEALSAPSYWVDCQDNGTPMNPWNLSHATPEAQPE